VPCRRRYRNSANPSSPRAAHGDFGARPATPQPPAFGGASGLAGLVGGSVSRSAASARGAPLSAAWTDGGAVASTRGVASALPVPASIPVLVSDVFPVSAARASPTLTAASAADTLLNTIAGPCLPSARYDWRHVQNTSPRRCLPGFGLLFTICPAHAPEVILTATPIVAKTPVDAIWPTGPVSANHAPFPSVEMAPFGPLLARHPHALGLPRREQISGSLRQFGIFVTRIGMVIVLSTALLAGFSSSMSGPGSGASPSRGRPEQQLVVCASSGGCGTQTPTENLGTAGVEMSASVTRPTAKSAVESAYPEQPNAAPFVHNSAAKPITRTDRLLICRVRDAGIHVARSAQEF
jgi:hypothetical protein